MTWLTQNEGRGDALSAAASRAAIVGLWALIRTPLVWAVACGCVVVIAGGA